MKRTYKLTAAGKIEQQLRDRRDLRQALIDRREVLDSKIATVEGQIATLTELRRSQ